MAIFDKKPEIPRSEFRDILKKSNIKVGQGRQLSERQRVGIEKKEFSKRLGPLISEREYKRTVNKLKSEKTNEQNFAKKYRLGKEIKFLEEIVKKPDLPK